MAKKALGKGLGALIKPAPTSPASDPNGTPGEERVSYLKVRQIVPSPHNPRKEFATADLHELAASIREHGIIQPLIVRQKGDQYELIAGERRWRASQSAALAVVPAIVRQATDREVIEMALIENLQRQDLNPIEEALGYQQLAKEFDLTQEEIAKRVGKSRASVANTLRLLDFTPEIQSSIAQGQLSVGHAKVILGVKNPEDQNTLVARAIREKFTVRQTEKAASSLRRPPALPKPPESQLAENILEEAQFLLQSYLKSQALVTCKGAKGTIQIPFEGQEELARLLALLSGSRSD